jgi:hypothetical protein
LGIGKIYRLNAAANKPIATKGTATIPTMLAALDLLSADLSDP